MNYGVHALMYSYYALRALRIRLPKQIAMVVTVFQISQMIMGIYVGITVYRMKSSGEQCQQTWENLGLCFLIYFTYFLLFCNFFYHAYLKKNNRYTGGTKATVKVRSIGAFDFENFVLMPWSSKTITVPTTFLVHIDYGRHTICGAAAFVSSRSIPKSVF
ncbi:GNS1/SUR4 family protein [Ancylostoma duodenale]|uniref:Elongation of very long chain fatty acids protein n=1 Tax=Ancylostoma duodenale TaxID=51022 RepID=A0A0C2FJF4_9BILA|nr:GNS1/SUR4 family protein [Ancylostoma duodenale]